MPCNYTNVTKNALSCWFKGPVTLNRSGINQGKKLYPMFGMFL